MRLSVLLSDCLVYIPACVLFVTTCLRQCSKSIQRRVLPLLSISVDTLRPPPFSQSAADRPRPLPVQLRLSRPRPVSHRGHRRRLRLSRLLSLRNGHWIQADRSLLLARLLRLSPDEVRSSSRPSPALNSF